MAYDNTNTGAIFKNKKKSSDKHPDRTGSINVEGQDYWISGWVKEKDGEQYLSLAITKKEKQSAKVEKAVPAKAPVDFDEDLPF